MAKLILPEFNKTGEFEFTIDAPLTSRQIDQIKDAVKRAREDENKRLHNARKQDSDGYHTFDELYSHRHALFIALLHRQQNKRPAAWKSRMHHDGTMYDGMFIAGIGEKAGEQITYHMPVRLYKELHVQSRQYAPEWDGHTPEDVVERLLALSKRK